MNREETLKKFNTYSSLFLVLGILDLVLIWLSFGNKDTIAPAVTKGNDSLREWINSEIETLGQENFFHKDYEETLVDTYGTDYEDSLVVEGGKTE